MTNTHRRRRPHERDRREADHRCALPRAARRRRAVRSRAELADANHQLEGARADIAGRDQTINGLRKDAQDKAGQQKQLDASTSTVSTKLAAAREDIRKVIHENPIVRSWADTALPDDVVRLSNTPAATGADDYRPGVPGDITLRAAGNGADD